MTKQSTIVVIGSLRVKWNGYTFKGGSPVKIILSPPEKRSSLKGMNLLEKGLGVQESRQEVTKFVLPL